MRHYLPLFLAIGLAACAEEQSGEPMYQTAKADRRTIEVSVSSSGVVEPLATVEVKSKASGEVLDVLVEVGDHVERDTLVVRIDPRTVRNDLAQREAELKAALSRREIARSQMARAEALLAKGTFTQLDLEQAALDLANAEADVVAAQVSVENSRIAVDDTDVRAPITGTVIQKPVERGQVISSPTRDVAGGSPLMQMADLSAVQIRALIDETDIGKIRPGMSAKVAVAAYPNQPFPGEVVKVEPQAVLEQNVTMFAVLVSIDNRDGLLMPGMNAEVEVSIARSEDVVTVPVMALRTNRDIAATAAILGVEETDLRAQLKRDGETGKGGGGGRRDGGTDYRFGGDFWVVMSADPEAGPEIRNVRTGITDLDRVEIVTGLQESESVLVLPSTHLFETQQDLQDWLSRRIGVPGIQRR
ncbi:MAG TPA: efflux RND transporter periplasmic adaptor subunit [Steroidobacteraceae bacterium]|nr:efflux RND transporter periplasmic adaptor subunit [Steroidobacteraceae bacterium]